MPAEPKELAAYWSVPRDGLLTALESTPRGLTSREAAARLDKYGPNALVVSQQFTTLRLLLKQFTSPLVLILIFAAIVSIFVGEWTDAAVILSIVIASALITFWQEYTASNVVAKLRERLTHRVNVLRDGKAAKVPVETVVPGDVVLLSAGSLIPADGVVLKTEDFYVNQAVLTGETFPVDKAPGEVAANASMPERTNCVFMGTSARSGKAEVLITRTGAMTSYGEIADQLGRQAPETEFERGIRQFGLMLTRIMVALILVAFAINVLMAKPPIDSLLFAIALAVGLSPELLPAIITINLSKGAREMARSGVIVRRLSAIENLGSMDVLCTDKTGTLTEGVVRLDATADVDGKDSERVFRLAYINASFETGLSNPLDEAITSGRTLDLTGVKKVSEVPYDFNRKRLSVVFDDAGVKTMATKGALDNVLAVCTDVRKNRSVENLTDKTRDDIETRFKAWSEQGFRVLGVASREITAKTAITRDDEAEMTFEGFILFFDPPKEDVHKAIEDLARLKVELKIITGDNRYVAAHVAEVVGLPVKAIVTGSEINDLSDEALWHAADRASLFVEVDPNQKERIIRAVKKTGHVVGYMGDGINDAPALHESDVGISVEGAVDVAREAADFVLLERGLHVLKAGIIEGRRTFANSLKYIFTTESANFGNMFSMAGASLFLPFLPLLAKQILLNNFLSDFPAIAIAGDNVDDEWVETPHRWNITFIRNFMIIFGLISSVFDFMTFGFLMLIVKTAPAEFQTGWFIESLLTELLVALIVRTRLPFYRSRPGRWLLISTILVAALTITIPYLPYTDIFGFVPLPLWVLSSILGITLMYVIATELAKRYFFRHLHA